MEYKVLHKEGKYSSEVVGHFEKAVNEFIKNGWKPLGGMSVSVDQYGWYNVYQAMIKE